MHLFKETVKAKSLRDLAEFHRNFEDIDRDWQVLSKNKWMGFGGKITGSLVVEGT